MPQAPGRPLIRVSGLEACYNGKPAVRGVSFVIYEGEQLSLLGPSGCGKTTTLRCIAGLETPTAGEIVIDDHIVFSARQGIDIPSERRSLSMVFQSYAIWPHMTVFENVAYPLRLRKERANQIKLRVTEVLRMVGMEAFIDQPATNLSGGQQQRVALARSYAYLPKALLLDEPLSNLDARLRVRMREELKRIQRQFRVTNLYVTHDQEEAMALSDRIIVMRDGVIEQVGKPLDIYDAPCSRFVADFIGAANILNGQVAERRPGEAVVLEIGSARLACAPRVDMPAPNAKGESLVAVRTVYPELRRGSKGTSVNCWPATIKERILLGDIVNYVVEWPGGVLRVQGFPNMLYLEGEPLWLHIPAERAILVDADEER
ncbi:ABC transporter ATP-binding protein [bacterium]|nr:MAG: ABC transporter ATP-binding protein [bacterium]